MSMWLVCNIVALCASREWGYSQLMGLRVRISIRKLKKRDNGGKNPANQFSLESPHFGLK